MVGGVTCSTLPPTNTSTSTRLFVALPATSPTPTTTPLVDPLHFLRSRSAFQTACSGTGPLGLHYITRALLAYAREITSSRLKIRARLQEEEDTRIERHLRDYEPAQTEKVLRDHTAVSSVLSHTYVFATFPVEVGVDAIATLCIASPALYELRDRFQAAGGHLAQPRPRT